MNKFMFGGRLSSDPEIRFTTDNKALCKFSMAIQRKFSKEKKADFFNLTIWGKPAENLARYTKKGSRITVVGRIENEPFTDRDGNKRQATNYIVEEFDLIDTKAETEGKQSGTSMQSAQVQKTDSSDDFMTVTDDDGELPFL